MTLFQCNEQFRYAGIGAGIFRPAMGVFVQNRFVASFQGFSIAMPFGQDSPDETFAAVADEIAISLHRMRWKAKPFQGRIGGVGNVGERVEQRPV